MSVRPPRPTPIRLGLILAALLTTATPAAAGPITFDFDAIRFNRRNDELRNGVVADYLQQVWSGTTVTGALALNGYDGDGHVVGQVVDGSFLPYTLGTTDRGVPHGRTNDAFIANNSGGQFTITLPEKVYSVSFDYQIFPNGHEQIPDMKFVADGELIFHIQGLRPGTDPNAPFTRSRVLNPETYYQQIGTFGRDFPEGVQTLTFIDWPPRVAIDNLTVTTAAPQAVASPEPLSVAPWLVCLAALGVVAWRVRRPGAAAQAA